MTPKWKISKTPYNDLHVVDKLGENRQLWRIKFFERVSLSSVECYLLWIGWHCHSYSKKIDFWTSKGLQSAESSMAFSLQ